MTTGVICPWCAAAETERVALRGSTLSTMLYRCRHCGMPFEASRWGRSDGLPRRRGHGD